MPAMEDTMKRIIALALAAVMAGCTSVDFHAYDDPNRVHHGTGGTRVLVNGVDIYTSGAPARDYMILGAVEAAVGDGVGADDMVRSAVALEIRTRGGDAGVLMSQESAVTGSFQGRLVTKRTARYYAIKYR
jgi:hypothetical protein